MNTSGVWTQHLSWVKPTPNHLSYRLTVSCVYHRYINVRWGGSRWRAGLCALGRHTRVTIPVNRLDPTHTTCKLQVVGLTHESGHSPTRHRDPPHLTLNSYRQCSLINKAGPPLLYNLLIRLDLLGVFLGISGEDLLALILMSSELRFSRRQAVHEILKKQKNKLSFFHMSRKRFYRGMTKPKSIAQVSGKHSLIKRDRWSQQTMRSCKAFTTQSAKVGQLFWIRIQQKKGVKSNGLFPFAN